MKSAQDYSHLWTLSYTGKTAIYAQAEFSGRDYSSNNKLIARMLSNVLPNHYKSVKKNLERRSYGYPALCTDDELCTYHVASDTKIPVTFYDLGVAGQRPLEISKIYNNIIREKGTSPLMEEVALADISSELIKLSQAIYLNDGSLNVLHTICGDFNDLTLGPVYRETDGLIRQTDRHSGEVLEANCEVNMEKRHLALLGRTINNFPDPVNFLTTMIGTKMNALDTLSIEGRYRFDNSVTYNAGSLRYIASHVVDNLGIGIEYFGGADSIIMEQNDSRIRFSINLNKDYVILKNSPLGFEGQILNNGSKLSVLENKVLDLPRFLTLCHFGGLETISLEGVGEDAIIILKKIEYDHDDGIGDFLPSNYRRLVECLTTQ